MRRPKISIVCTGDEKPSPYVGDTEKTRIVRQWHINLVGSNGEIVLTSETYTRKADAVRATKALRRIAALAKIEEGPLT